MPQSPTMSNKLKAFVGDRNAPSGGIGGALKDWVDPEAFQKVADVLYKKKAESHDSIEIMAHAREIENILKTDAGVLLVRYTGRQPNGADQTLPTYLALIVVGGGASRATAIADYEKRINTDTADGAKVCTPLNPTGQRQPGRDTMQATPEGKNVAYNSQAASKLGKLRDGNPTNDKKVGIVSRSFYDEDYVFISREQWEKLKKRK